MKKLNVVIASHIYATGPALELEEYLKTKVNKLTFIGHPFPFASNKQSFLRTYNNGKKTSSNKFRLSLHPALFYLRDYLLTLWWGLRFKGKISLFIGSDNFLASAGLILKKLGKVEDVILYTIDYSPQRFSSKLMNKAYHYLDKQCLKHCKIVWNVSPAIEKARLKDEKVGGPGYAKQIVVPLGVWYKRIKRLPIEKRNKGRIVFMGHVLKKQGLDKVFEALPLVLKKVPEAHLVVVGSGEYLPVLQKKSKKLGIQKKVKFLGYVKDHKKVEQELSKSMIAVATYEPDPKSFTNYADPGKIKNYLAAGLPIVLTDVPPIAKQLEKKKCALIAKYDSSDIANQLSRLLSNKALLQKYSDNASEYSKIFDWSIIFKQALQESAKYQNTKNPQKINQKKYFEGELGYIDSYEGTLNAWRKSYIQRIIENLPKKSITKTTVLDVGTGSGYVAIEMAKLGASVIATDITPKALKIVDNYKKKNKDLKIKTIKCDASDIPLKTSSVDFLVANSVLEHIPNEAETINEWKRVVKPKGKLFITVPIKSKYVLPIFWPINYIYDKKIGHLRRYDKNSVEEKFDAKVERVYYTGHLIKTLWVIGSRIAMRGIRKSSRFDEFFEKIDAASEKSKYGSNIMITVMINR